MTNHLSTSQIIRLSVSALTEDEAAAAAVHCAECQSCHQQFVEELRRQRGSVPFTFTLEPEFWFRDDHVDFDLLVALADQTLDEERKEIVNIHLKTCETCRADVSSFLASRDASAREMDISYDRPGYQASHGVEAAPWWRRLQSPPIYALAAIVLLAVSVLIGIIAIYRISDPLDARKQDQTNPEIEQSPGLSPSPASSMVSSPSSVDDSAKVAVLKDAGGEVTIDKNGRVTGLDQVSEKSRQYIARAALSERIEPADVLGRFLVTGAACAAMIMKRDFDFCIPYATLWLRIDRFSDGRIYRAFRVIESTCWTLTGNMLVKARSCLQLKRNGKHRNGCAVVKSSHGS